MKKNGATTWVLNGTALAAWVVLSASAAATGCYDVGTGTPDGGARADAAAPDTGHPDRDGGARPDAGAHDAGAAEDVPGPGDGGAPDDAWVGPDEGAGDTGAATDGAGLDAAVDAGLDGGADAGPDAEADGGCAPPIVFTRPEEFIPTVAAPVLHVDIPMESGLVFGKVEVEIDFVRGPWSTVPPGPSRGMSNVFWLHRGMKANHWLGNLVGYMNFKSQVTLEASANLGISDPAIWNQSISKRVPTTQGELYHVHFAYDAAGGKLWYRAFHGGTEIAYVEDVPLVSEIEGRDIFQGGQPGFFIEIGFVSGDGQTVEIPTYDWVYSNIVITFHHLGGC